MLGKIMKVLTLLVCMIHITGCASVVSGGPKTLPIMSQPDDAALEIIDVISGNTITKAKTPYTATLERSSGFFQNAKYKMKIAKDGYLPYETQIESNINGWYFGNIIFGGLIGILIVDPATGAMWKIYEDNINIKLLKYIPTVKNDAFETSVARMPMPQDSMIGPINVGETRCFDVTFNSKESPVKNPYSYTMTIVSTTENGFTLKRKNSNAQGYFHHFYKFDGGVFKYSGNNNFFSDGKIYSETTYRPESLVLPSTMTKNTFEETASYLKTTGLESMTGSITKKIIVNGEDSLTTPAGTFNAIKITVTELKLFDSGGSKPSTSMQRA